MRIAFSQPEMAETRALTTAAAATRFSLLGIAHAAAAMLAARSGNREAQRIIDAQQYLHRVAGTAQRRETATPGGTCQHVGQG